MLRRDSDTKLGVFLEDFAEMGDPVDMFNEAVYDRKWWLSRPERIIIETSIADDVELSMGYASHVVEDRWPKGEPAILTDPDASCKYAMSIIRGRWPEGEAIIATGPDAAFSYAMSVIGGPWPEGEAAIASEPASAVRYVLYVIKRPWPEAEATIATDERLSAVYKEFCGKFYERQAFEQRRKRRAALGLLNRG